MIFDSLILEALVYYESRNINDFFEDAFLLTSSKDDLWLYISRKRNESDHLYCHSTFKMAYERSGK